MCLNHSKFPTVIEALITSWFCIYSRVAFIWINNNYVMYWLNCSHQRERKLTGVTFLPAFFESTDIFFSDCYFGFQVFILSNLSLYSLWYFLYSWGSQSRDSWRCFNLEFCMWAMKICVWALLFENIAMWKLLLC